MAADPTAPDPFTLETPAAPLASPEEPATTGTAPTTPATAAGAPSATALSAAPRPPRFPALRAGLAHAWKSRRALLFVVCVQIVLALVVVAPLHARLRGAFDSHAQAGALAGERDAVAEATGFPAGIDPGYWGDFRRVEAPFLEGITVALAWIAVVAWAFGALAAGGFLSTAHAAAAGGAPQAQTVPPSVTAPKPTASSGTAPAPAPADAGPKGACARFLAGGGRWFWPMLRMSLCFLLVVEVVLGRLVFEAWGPAAAKAERAAASGWTAWIGERTREGAFLCAFLFFRAAADLGRAHLVLRGRRSAFLAFLRGIATLIRRPLRAGGLALAVALPEVALLMLFAACLSAFPGGGTADLIGAFLLLQAAVLVRWASRAALLAGDLRLLTDLKRRRDEHVRGRPHA